MLRNLRAKRKNRLLQQVIPVEEEENEIDGARDEQPSSEKRSSKNNERPGFSLPLMTNNFRRFNARYEPHDAIKAIPLINATPESASFLSSKRRSSAS